MADNVAFLYAVLATVSVRQPFYVDGVARKFAVEPELDFEIYPTGECAETMRRLDIVFRRSDRNGGVTLLARVLGKTAGGDDILRFRPAPADKLTFWMHLRNPNVLNFDDLPIALDPANLYYFTNQQTDAAAPRNDLHLTEAATGVDSDHDRIRRSVENYTFRHEAEVAPDTAKVKHVLSGIEVLPSSIVNKSGKSDLTFDLHSLPLGRCDLQIGGAVKDRFYLAPTPEPREFAVIELVLASTLAANYRLVEPDRSLSSARPAYSMRFANRKTRWRYTIALSPNGPLAADIAVLSDADKQQYLSHLNITSNDPAITFTPAAPTDRLLVFVSDADIALREQYVVVAGSQLKPLSLSLTKNVGSSNDVVRSDLPYPPNSSIDARAAPPVFSDTFLTI
jgi:hypothetical protein